MLLVVIAAEFVERCFELGHVEVGVLLDGEHVLDLVEIGGVEAAGGGGGDRGRVDVRG